MRDEVVKYSEEIVEQSHLCISKVIAMLGVNRPKYYDWLKRFGIENYHNGKIPKKHWLTPEERQAIIDYARKHIGSHQYYLQDGYRRIAYMGIDLSLIHI